jgi:hypothetical protein
MYRFFIYIFLIFSLPALVTAQVTTDTSKTQFTDTLPLQDSVRVDTIPKRIIRDSIPVTDSAKKTQAKDSVIEKSIEDSLTEEKAYGDLFNGNTQQGSSKEILFYAIILVLLLFAFLNRLFPKYFSDLYRLFFRTTLNQSQIKEQMMQSPLASLLLNFFFVITAGMYLNFLFQHYNVKPVDNFWLLFLYCSISLAAIYFIKYLGLKFSGWIFNASNAADAYIFIVFVINKMIGIFLLPIIIILALTSGKVYDIGIGFSYFGIAAFIIYRFILVYASIRNQIRVNPFHFFLYILAFEILPLFIIYKLLLEILEITA